jgi:hypothetical protein
MWRSSCSDKDSPIEEKDEMRSTKNGAYRAVTKILQ